MDYADGDKDDTNELSDLSLDGSNVLTLSNPATGGNSVDLSGLLGTDSQDLSLSGDELSLTGDPTATPIDLSGYLDNTDNQDLTISGNTLSLTGDATPVTLPTADGSETVINDGSNTTVNGSGTSADPYTIDVPANTDSQDLSLSGDELSLTGDPTATPIDLGAYTETVTGANDITVTDDGSGNYTVDYADGDKDDTNELSDLSLDGSNVLTLSNPATGGNSVDLSGLLGTDSQDLSLSGDELSLTGDPTATPIDLGAYTETVTGANDITVTDDGSGNYTVDYADGDKDDTNELSDLSLDGSNVLTLSNPATGGNSVDLSGLLGTDSQAEPERRRAEPYRGSYSYADRPWGLHGDGYRGERHHRYRRR
ncbi:hypothetical protein GVT53_01760 [Flagellimonas oceani]|uniref:Uncharacterized protein n=1 Tax=Flagellimonas oceani TaxID=2698672 RepID=A0A6G7IYS0_9FLAO|nr:hypothetical protein [Allomuricauda oceani]QII43464.1 hypothetical protein GVT53_01760 [Allomuricauda oceani]